MQTIFLSNISCHPNGAFWVRCWVLQKSLELRRELLYRTFQGFLPRPRTFIYIFSGKKNCSKMWEDDESNPWIHSLSVYVIFGCFFFGVSPESVGSKQGSPCERLHGLSSMALELWPKESPHWRLAGANGCRRWDEAGAFGSFLPLLDIFLWGFLGVTCHLAWKVECIWILNRP